VSAIGFVLAGILFFGILLLRPVWYLIALFVVAPCGGLWVQLGWMVDVFKIGLLMSPLLLLRSRGRLGPIGWPVSWLLLWSVSLLLWQLITEEGQSFDDLGHLGFVSRLVVANGMFFLRVLLLILISIIVQSRKQLEGLLKAFVWSVFLSSVYAIIQEVFFLLSMPLSGVNAFGLGLLTWLYPTTQVSGLTLMRVNAFCPEPKDFALFLVPAIVLLWSSRAAGGPVSCSSPLFYWLRICVMVTAAALTFSTSLIVTVPVIVITLYLLRPKRGEQFIRQTVSVIVLAAIAIVLGQQTWDVRVNNRVASVLDILQPARERPALEFVMSEWPRPLLGYGVGTQAFYLPKFMPSEFRRSLWSADAAAGLDSFWFGLFLDLGLPGVFLFAWICWSCLRSSQSGESRTSWPYRATLIALLIVSIALPSDLRSGLVWLILGACWRHQQLDTLFRKPAETYRLRLRLVANCPTVNVM
jgi:hypothetical protein